MRVVTVSKNWYLSANSFWHKNPFLVFCRLEQPTVWWDYLKLSLRHSFVKPSNCRNGELPSMYPGSAYQMIWSLEINHQITSCELLFQSYALELYFDILNCKFINYRIKLRLSRTWLDFVPCQSKPFLTMIIACVMVDVY